ncbi:MAG: GDSL-type esterase/lipase family protein, partial [Acidobacteriota bacterium]|nr:GDSL-type esterase/lipase family protein [Acidobacteriota bacterium]
PPAGAAPSKAPGKRLVLVLGDSLSHGTGDPSGRGYANDVVDLLRRAGPVESVNLAVAGVESSDVLALVESANVKSLAASADLILLSVGGNDLSHSLGRAGAPTEALTTVVAARAQFARNLRKILARLRETNPSAPIRLLGLYQPFTGSGREARIGASMVMSWNSLVAETALGFDNVSAIPVFDLFEGRADRLAADRFHPNRAGYRAIADRVIQSLPAGS